MPIRITKIIKNRVRDLRRIDIFAARLYRPTPGFGDKLQISSVGRNKRGISSSGRALAWHVRGDRFDPGILHKKPVRLPESGFFILPID